MKKIKNMVVRNRSVVSGKKGLKSILKLKNFPVFFGCVDSPKKDDLVADMNWGIDPDSGMIQLTKLIPLNILYQEQHVDGYGPTWEQYYNDFAQYVVSKKQAKILEIGGGSGVLALIATKADTSVLWTMVEPNPLFSGSARIKVVNGFFNKNFKLKGSFDAVTFSQVMEHAYYPKEFLDSIGNFLKPGGRLIFAYPNLKLWLEKKFTNALNFEHTMFLTDYFVDYLLAKSGFIILDKTIYKNHSFFYDAEFIGKEQPFSLKSKYSEYTEIFVDFVNYHKNMVKDINRKIISSDRPVYLFGAHIFSTFLFTFGLESKNIVSILDNSKLKQGRRLYGTNFIVHSPEILKGKGPVNLILRAGIYNNEIKKDILENINSEVTFW